jgi:hypothetical protein
VIFAKREGKGHARLSVISPALPRLVTTVTPVCDISVLLHCRFRCQNV